MEKVTEKTIKYKGIFMEQSISHQLAAQGDDIKIQDQVTSLICELVSNGLSPLKLQSAISRDSQ